MRPLIYSMRRIRLATAAAMVGAVLALPVAATSSASPTAGPPDPPTGISLSSADTHATFTWTNAAPDGSAIWSQVIYAYGMTSVSAHEPVTTTRTDCSGSPCTVTGLTIGLIYYFDIATINDAGEGPLSETLGPVTPAGLPGAPTIISVTPSDSSARIRWVDGASNGSPVSPWTIYVFAESSLVATKTDCPGSPCTVTGLTNGTSYTFEVSDTNDMGEGPRSAASSEVTPAGPPAAPASPSVTPGNASLQVRWTPPDANGSTITTYTAIASPGSRTCRYVVASPETDTCRITGLANGVAYTVTVTARNATGASGPSTSSGEVYPEPTSAFTIYPSTGIALAGTTVSAIISGAPSLAAIRVRLAGASTSCTASRSGQCVVVVTATASLASPRASYGSGAGRHSVAWPSSLAVPAIDLPAKWKHHKALSVMVSAALPRSTLTMVLTIAGSSVSGSAIARPSGAATLRLKVPDVKGLATLSVTDAGVTVATGSIVIH